MTDSRSKTTQPLSESVITDDDNPKRRQILDGARQMFMSKGFEGTSMQDVASAAKVSKGTLYVYFDNKEAMFEALVLAECNRMHRTLKSLATGTGNIAEELRQIAVHMIRTLLHPEILAAMRMLIGAGEKFPDLARLLYETGPARSMQILADYLQRRSAAGDLEIEDCLEAGAEFVDLVLSGQQKRALLMMPPLGPDEIAAYADRRVAHFMSMYGPRKG